MPDVAEARGRLEAQLAELEDRLTRIERDLGEEPTRIRPSVRCRWKTTRRSKGRPR